MKKIVSLILLAALILGGCGTGGNGQSSDKKDYGIISSGNNELAFKLLPEIEAGDDGNIFISPTSLYFALSMLYNGADGETKKEIEQVLQVENPDQVNEANAWMMEKLTGKKKDIELHIANSIWVSKRFTLQDEFKEKNEKYYKAEIEEIDVNDPKTPGIINDWVSKATKKKIDEIVKPPLNPDLVAYLINAIYFKGNWKYEFDEKATEPGSFYLLDGTEKEVNYMTLGKKLPYFETDGFQAVSLPYGEEGNMSMNIFLPKDYEAFKEELTNENWERWSGQFAEKDGTIRLPKFKLEYEIGLNEALKTLGMPSAFSKSEANLSKLIEEKDPIWVSEVKQKTYIDVNEKGTEAAAVTSVEVVTESATGDLPFYMEVNRPFFFTITDNETKTILFLGEITNPVEKEE